MQLQVVKSKNAISYYIIESFSYKDETGKRKYSSRVVEKLGTHKALLEKLKGQDPHEWCKQRVAELNQKKKEGKEEIISRLPSNQIIAANQRQCFLVGHLFLLPIIKELDIASFCKTIAEKYKLKYDLANILTVVIYTKILTPSSKLEISQLADKYLFQDSIPAERIDKALEILNKERDYILAVLHKNIEHSMFRDKLETYFDCANCDCETKESDDSRSFDISMAQGNELVGGIDLFYFLALLVCRLLEAKMEKKYRSDEIVSQLQAMQLAKCGETNYVPAYTRTDITDELHRVFGFRTDYMGFDSKGINKLKKFAKL